MGAFGAGGHRWGDEPDLHRGWCQALQQLRQEDRLLNTDWPVLEGGEGSAVDGHQWRGGLDGEMHSPEIVGELGYGVGRVAYLGLWRRSFIGRDIIGEDAPSAMSPRYPLYNSTCSRAQEEGRDPN